MAEEHYLGNPLLKKANTTIELSQEQLLELAKCSEDVIYFAKNYIKIVTLDEGLVNFKPYPFQETMLKNFKEKRFNVCKLPRQPLWINTPIPTTRGWVKMRDVAVGDQVYNPDGLPVRVIKKSETFYNKKCYKVHFHTGECIIADEEHMWKISHNNSEVIWQTKDLFNNFKHNNLFYIKAASIPEGYDVDFHNSPICKKHYIVKVEIVSSVPTACITVDDPSHLFLCGKSFIPTHNSGKSTTTVAFLVHDIVFNEHTSIAILANKASTAKEILSRLQTAYENLPKWMQQGVKSWNKTSMELENGSKVIAASTSASSVRGGTYSILMLDEYAFVPQQVANNFMRSVYPTITSGKETKVIVVSCVTKDTYILTEKGYRKIERLIDPDKLGPYFTDDYSVYGKKGFHDGKVILNNGKVDTKIIHTKYGKIECSFQHKFWTKKGTHQGIYRAHSLQNNDYISIKYNTQIFGNLDYVGLEKDKSGFACQYMNKDIAYLVGLFLSKGYVRGTRVVIAYEGDLKECLDHLNLVWIKLDKLQYVIYNTNLINLLTLLGFKFTECKEIPDKVVSWSRENIVSMLKGILDTSSNYYEKEKQIECVIGSDELANQFKLLLANLGILSTHNKRNNKNYVSINLEFNANYNQIFNDRRIKNNFFSTIIGAIKKEDSICDFIKDKVDSTLVWTRIINVEESSNEVYDVSLPEIEGDYWCHSVLYNNFLGFQTPQGMNHYYKLWMDAKNGKNNYHPFEIHWSDVPGRDEAWKQEQINNLGLKDFEQEFSTEFLGSSETLISGTKLAQIVHKKPIKSIKSLDVFHEPKKEHVYVTVVDTARGVEKDYHAFTVIDITQLPYEVVAKYKNNEIKPELYSYVVKDTAFTYNQSYILCEVNDIGYQIARDLVEDEYPNMLMCSTKSRSGQFVGQNFSGKFEYGVKMQKNIKKVGALKLKTLIEENKLIINDVDIFSELTTFIQKGTTFEAEIGKNDDLVMCLLIFAWLTTNQYFKDITDIDIRTKLLQEQKDKEEEDLLPFGFIPQDDTIQVDQDGTVWQAVEQDEMNAILSMFNMY